VWTARGRRVRDAWTRDSDDGVNDGGHTCPRAPAVRPPRKVRSGAGARLGQSSEARQGGANT